MSSSSDVAREAFIHRTLEAFPEAKGLRGPGPGTSITEVWEAITSQLHVSPAELAEKLSAISAVPLATGLEKTDLALAEKLPYTVATSTLIAPLRVENGVTVVAVPNPFDESLLQSIHFVYGVNVRVELAPPKDIEVAIARIYAEIKENKSTESIESKRATRALNEREIPRLARQLLERAISLKASDIHIQPFVGGSAIRVRVDGMLRRLAIIPESVSDALIRFFKAQGKMDPTNILIPQDGRMHLKHGAREYDLRLSILPVSGNEEKLVIRILNRSAVYQLQKSGMSPTAIHALRRMASNPSGVVLLCGPTGSGKTTTLYSMLSELNTEAVSIATVENPVEYHMPGLSQTEINIKAGVTFDSALRAILRQDPDIILIGEIRDAETAQIAMQSALTGHLVFSTLHTNDAVTVIPRLLDLGIPPPILAEALSGIVSQRLLRKLCEHCRRPPAAELAADEQLFEKITRVKPGAHAAGCEQCNYTGYQGRVVVSEMIEINPALVSLISAGETSAGRLLEACGENYTSIAEVAARRIISGDTTPAEATRVIGRQFWTEIAKAYKSEVSDFGLITIDRSEGSKGQPGVLIAGPASGLITDIADTLTESWFRVITAETPADAKTRLQEQDEISFVILDLPDNFTDKQIIEYVAEYRVAMAWSRLPALILLPADRPALKTQLIEHGATSRFARKSIAGSDLVTLINEALSFNADFRWGLDKDES